MIFNWHFIQGKIKFENKQSGLNRFCHHIKNFTSKYLKKPPPLRFSYSIKLRILFILANISLYSNVYFIITNNFSPPYWNSRTIAKYRIARPLFTFFSSNRKFHLKGTCISSSLVGKIIPLHISRQL